MSTSSVVLGLITYAFAIWLTGLGSFFLVGQHRRYVAWSRRSVLGIARGVGGVLEFLWVNFWDLTIRPVVALAVTLLMRHWRYGLVGLAFLALFVIIAFGEI